MQELQRLGKCFFFFFFPGKKHSSHLIKVEVVVRIHDTKCLNSAVCDTVNLLCMGAQELTGEGFSCLL